LRKIGKPDEAVAVIKDALMKRKGDPDLFNFLSVLYQEDGKLAEAEQVLKEGLVFSPRNTDLHYRLGVIYEATNRFDESIREMEEVLKLDPNHADALNFIGYSLAERGVKLDEAEKMIKKALQLKPGSGYITDSLGWVYFKQNKNDLALKYLKEAASLMPEDPLIQEHLGDIYARMGMIKEAVAAYRASLKLNPGQESVATKIERLLKKK